MLTRRHFLKNACAVALGFLGLHKFIAGGHADFIDTQTFSDRVRSLNCHKMVDETLSKYIGNEAI